MVILLVVCLIMGLIGMFLGEDREIGKTKGFFLGFLLGVIGLIIVVASKRNDEK